MRKSDTIKLETVSNVRRLLRKTFFKMSFVNLMCTSSERGFENDTPFVAAGFHLHGTEKQCILQANRALPKSKSDGRGPDRHPNTKILVLFPLM
jgi:hypothetical protein